MKNQNTECLDFSKSARLFRPLALLVILGAGLTAVAAQDAVTPAAPSDSTMPQEAATLSHGDKSFIKKVARGSTNEVALSQLADSRASNPEIKSFALMMITDHDLANTDLQALALSKGIDISKPVSKGGTDDVSNLSSKSGVDFDKAFIKNMLSAHQGVVDLFKKEVANGKDPDVVAFAKKYVDTLSMHLEHAKALERTINQ
jgi:putative membrane protein